MAFLTKAGTFNAATATGNQAVIGVGFQPKAIMLWAVGGTTEATFQTVGYVQAIGFATSPTNQFSQSSLALASSSTGTYRRVETCAFHQTNSTNLIRRANLASIDADGFTLNWTTARSDGAYRMIHYLALGGQDLIGATVVNWQTPTAVGAKAVIGAGFSPDAVLHAHAGDQAGFTDGSITTPTPAAFGLGVMTSAGDQWANGFATSSTSVHARSQVSTQTITMTNPSAAIIAQAAYTSMDPDGFTTNFGVAAATAYQVISLCLRGGRYKAGQFTKSTSAAPVSQAVAGVGFAPTGVLLAGVQDIVRAAPLAGGGTAYGLGVSDGTTKFGSALYGAANASRESVSKTTKAYVNGGTGAGIVVAEADLTSLDVGGFTLNWTTNNAVSTSIMYLAVGDLPLFTIVTLPDAVTASALALPITTITGSRADLPAAASAALAPSITTATGSRADLTVGTSSSTALPVTASIGSRAFLAPALATAAALAPAATGGTRVTLPLTTASAASALGAVRGGARAILPAANANAATNNITLANQPATATLSAPAQAIAAALAPISRIDRTVTIGGPVTATAAVANVTTVGGATLNPSAAILAGQALNPTVTFTTRLTTPATIAAASANPSTRLDTSLGAPAIAGAQAFAPTVAFTTRLNVAVATGAAPSVGLRFNVYLSPPATIAALTAALSAFGAAYVAPPVAQAAAFAIPPSVMSLVRIISVGVLGETNATGLVVVQSTPQGQIVVSSIPRYRNAGELLVTSELWRADKAGTRLELLNRGSLGAVVTHNDDATDIKRTMQIETFRELVPLRPLRDCLIPVMRLTQPDGTTREQAFGHYVIMPSGTEETYAATTGAIVCYDIAYYLTRSSFREGYTVPGGIDYGAAVRTIIGGAGFTASQMLIPNTTRLTPAAGIYFPPGTTRILACNALLNGIGWYTMHVNNAGQFTSSPYIDYQHVAVSATYSGLSDGTIPVMPVVQLEPDVGRLRNVVTVRNIPQEGPVIYYTAVNNDPSSPLWVGGEFGELAGIPIDDSQVLTTADAKRIAENLLKLGESFYQRLKVQTGPDLDADGRNVVALNLPRAGRPPFTGRWLRQGWELPFDSVAPIMTHTLNRVEPWSTAVWT